MTVETGGSSAFVRAAVQADAQLLLAWRNDPETRRASRNTGAVTDSEHESWLEDVLADPDRHLLVVEVDGEPAAQVRFDALDGGGHEISVTVAPRMRGRGVAATAIAEGVGWLRARDPAAVVVAHVRPENARSMRAFARAGFAESGETDADGFARLVSRP
jgi:RimJ/RimL family protein N-acetyltransferase